MWVVGERGASGCGIRPMSVPTWAPSELLVLVLVRAMRVYSSVLDSLLFLFDRGQSAQRGSWKWIGGKFIPAFVHQPCTRPGFVGPGLSWWICRSRRPEKIFFFFFVIQTPL